LPTDSGGILADYGSMPFYIMGTDESVWDDLYIFFDSRMIVSVKRESIDYISNGSLILVEGVLGGLSLDVFLIDNVEHLKTHSRVDGKKAVEDTFGFGNHVIE